MNPEAGPEGRPGREQPTPVSVGGLRHWLVLWSVLMLGVMLSSVWIFYAYTHTNTRFHQLPPGASQQVSGGATVRVLKMWQTQVLEPGAYRTTVKPVSARPGMTFVVVRFEVTAAESGRHCGLELAVDPGARYDSFTNVPSGRELNQYCSELIPGRPEEKEIIFQVPTSQLSRISGVAVNSSTRWNHQTHVLRPAD